MFSVTVLNKVTNSMSILIKDIQFANKMSVSEHYCLFCCDAMQLPNVLEEHSASISRAARGCSLGQLLDPATVGKIRQKAQQFLH
jgi:hypothetical protein